MTNIICLKRNATPGWLCMGKLDVIYVLLVEQTGSFHLGFITSCVIMLGNEDIDVLSQILFEVVSLSAKKVICELFSGANLLTHYMILYFSAVTFQVEHESIAHDPIFILINVSNIKVLTRMALRWSLQQGKINEFHMTAKYYVKYHTSSHQ